MNTRGIVTSNNKACVLIRQGSNESAIVTLFRAMLSLFHSHHHRPEPHQKQFPLEQICNADTNDHPLHYYPKNDSYENHDEGMRVFQQPLHILHDESKSIESIEATIFYNLGIAYARIGDNQESLTCCKKSLKLQRVIVSTFGDEENKQVINGPAIHLILLNIGHAYWKSAEYTEAVKVYSEALNYLASNHLEHNKLDIASTLNCIAVSMLYAGIYNTDDILTILEKALALRLGSPGGPEHDRESATIIYNFGRVRFIRREFHAAFKVCKKAYNERVAALGQNHIDVAACLFHMAQAKQCQGHVLEAIGTYEQFVEILSAKKDNGTSNIEMVIKVLMTIGQLFYDQGDLDQAHDAFSRALDSTKGSNTPPGESVAKIFKMIGRILFDQKKLYLSLEAFKSGLAVERRVYPEFHVYIALSLMDIARIKHCQSDLDLCLQFNMEALEILRHLNEQNEVARMLIDLGMLHEERGNIQNAIEALDEAVTTLRRDESNREQSSLLPCALNILGLLQFKKGSFTLALRSFLEAIKIYRTYSYGEEFPASDVAAVYQNAGTVCRKIGEGDKALHYYNMSLYLGEMHYQGSYERSASLKYEIGMIFKEREDFDEALTHLNRSLQICMESATTANGIDRLATKIFLALADLYLQKGDLRMAMHSLEDGMGACGVSGSTDSSWNLFINNVGDFTYHSFLYQIIRKTNPQAAAAA